LFGNGFTIKVSDIDLWPSDLKNKRGHLHIMTYHHRKFEDSRLKCLAVIDRKPFDPTLQLKVTVTLTYDLKNNRGLLCVMTNHHTKFKDSRLYLSPVTDRKPSIYQPTDRQTRAKQYTPTFFKGGYKNVNVPPILFFYTCSNN